MYEGKKSIKATSKEAIAEVQVRSGGSGPEWLKDSCHIFIM